MFHNSNSFPVTLGSSWASDTPEIISMRYERRGESHLQSSDLGEVRVVGALELRAEPTLNLHWYAGGHGAFPAPTERESRSLVGSSLTSSLESGRAATAGTSDCLLIFDGSVFTLERVETTITNLRPVVSAAESAASLAAARDRPSGEARKRRLPIGKKGGAATTKSSHKRVASSRTQPPTIAGKRARARLQIRSVVVSFHSLLKTQSGLLLTKKPGAVSKTLHPKPRGRTPKCKAWNSLLGTWEALTVPEMYAPTSERAAARPANGAGTKAACKQEDQRTAE